MRMTSRDDISLRLDDFLARWLPEVLGLEISRAQVRKLILGGAVYLSSRRMTQPQVALREGTRVEVLVDVEKLKTPVQKKDQVFELREEHILFEDSGLIAVNKPPGLPTQATLDPLRPHLYGCLQAFLKNREGREVYVGLHHRLDRDTSGVVLFTTDPDRNGSVSSLFSKHEAQKKYVALVALLPGSPLLTKQVGQSWSMKNHLGKDPRSSSGKRTRFASLQKGGDFAHTDFTLLERFGRFAWVEAYPRTGRTHQIRVHLSEQKAPILGDDTYGETPEREVRAPARTVEAARLMLHAACLTFPHPVSKVETAIVSPLPEDFQQCLQNLRSLNLNASSQ
jgi:RluA family pseudouridine synthase